MAGWFYLEIGQHNKMELLDVFKKKFKPLRPLQE